VGVNAARMALGLGAEVTLLDIRSRTATELDDRSMDSYRAAEQRRADRGFACASPTS
jgi:alanine dehydrogenase